MVSGAGDRFLVKVRWLHGMAALVRCSGTLGWKFWHSNVHFSRVLRAQQVHLRLGMMKGLCLPERTQPNFCSASMAFYLYTKT